MYLFRTLPKRRRSGGHGRKIQRLNDREEVVCQSLQNWNLNPHFGLEIWKKLEQIISREPSSVIYKRIFPFLP